MAAMTATADPPSASSQKIAEEMGGDIPASA
jgi:hypothetical protein